MDLTIYKALNGLAANNDWLEDPFRFVANQAELFFLAVLAALFLARGKWRSVHGRRGVAVAGFGALVALAIGHFIADLWDRARPYEAHPQIAHLFVTRSADPLASRAITQPLRSPSPSGSSSTTAAPDG